MTSRCNHSCALCCNKLYNIDNIPVVTVELLKSVQTVCLTGGEPFNIPHYILIPMIKNMRTQFPNIENLYVYTSGIFDEDHLNSELITGVTMSPKSRDEWKRLKYLITTCDWFFNECHSNRLYVFKEDVRIAETFLDTLPKSRVQHIEIIHRTWDETFNTPPNEYFARLPILFDICSTKQQES